VSASRTLARFSLAAAILGVAGAATPASAATIGITGSAVDPVVIIGGSTTLEATVTNTGASGDGDLNYAISFYTPGGPAVSNDTLASGDSDTWQATYDSTGQPYGENLTGVVVTDPAATNSPAGTEIGVTVLAHAQPYVSNGFGPLLSLVAEPTIDFLAFGATGGGETFAAYVLSIVNDPAVPTAGLDLDFIDPIGDSQITADLTNFSNLAFDDDPANGHLFNVFVNTTELGTFSTTFHLYFSDQDLPGASAPNSVVTSFSVVATVVPEPASASLFALGLAALAAGARQRRRRG